MRCDFCGREWIFVWPELWPYRYEGKVFCSENCKICDSTLIKLGRGKKKLMSRIKKDGTPARKPGPKAGRKPASEKLIRENTEKADKLLEQIREDPPKVKLTGPILIETPDANKVEVVETPESAEPKALLPATYDGMVIREVEGLFGRYRYSGDLGRAEYIDFENADGMDTLSMTVDQWKKFREEQVKAALILGVRL